MPSDWNWLLVANNAATVILIAVLFLNINVNQLTPRPHRWGLTVGFILVMMTSALFAVQRNEVMQWIGPQGMQLLGKATLIITFWFLFLRLNRLYVKGEPR